MRFCVCVWILVVLSLAVTIMEEQWWDNVIAQSLSVLLFLSFSPAFFHPSGQWVTPCCPSAGRRTHYLQLWWHAPPHNTYDLSKLAPHTSSLPPNESLYLCSQDLWQQLLNFNQKMTRNDNKTKPGKGHGKSNSWNTSSCSSGSSVWTANEPDFQFLWKMLNVTRHISPTNHSLKVWLIPRWPQQWPSLLLRLIFGFLTSFQWQ